MQCSVLQVQVVTTCRFRLRRWCQESVRSNVPPMVVHGIWVLGLDVPSLCYATAAQDHALCCLFDVPQPLFDVALLSPRTDRFDRGYCQGVATEKLQGLATFRGEASSRRSKCVIMFSMRMSEIFRIQKPDIEQKVHQSSSCEQWRR